MPLFELPTALAVRDDSRLLPEQVSAAYSDADLLGDIDERIAAAAMLVQGTLSRAAAPYAWPLAAERVTAAYPTYSEAEVAAETARQAGMAGEATRLFALASLYSAAGALNRAYYDKAVAYRHDGDLVVDELKEAVALVRAAQTTQPGAADGIGVWSITVGEEFSSCAG